MLTLLDTNILLRCVQAEDRVGLLAEAAVDILLRGGRTLCISSQNIYEFLAVSTRPTSENGLSWSHVDADAALSILLENVEIFYDTPAVAQETRRLVVAHRVTGKKVHDTRLVATMRVNGVKEILTLNKADFIRYGGIEILVPGEVAGGNLLGGEDQKLSGAGQSLRFNCECEGTSLRIGGLAARWAGATRGRRG